MDFFKQYFDYVGETEAPALYHRWCAVSLVGAMLGRQVHIPFGHGKIYPNQYIMLMGSPGARKGTAINIGRKLLSKTGYKRFAPDRTSKERFLIDLKPAVDFDDEDQDLELLVFDAPSEIYAVAEEFTDWVGQSDMGFMTMLTKLWDNMDRYEHPKITGKNVVVEKPTVNILGGNTVQGLALALPPEALGNGFMSRMIFVHSEATGKKITFPKPVDKTKQELLLTHLITIKEEIKGEMAYEAEAKATLERIYTEFKDIDDPRFKHYSARRFIHLLKLSMIISIMHHRQFITKEDVLKANTLLHYTERRMPKALGEFGKSKYSDVSNNILEYLNHQHKPASMNEVWKLVAKDLNKISELGDIMKNLLTSQKIQVVTIAGKQGYMPLHKTEVHWDEDLLLDDFLYLEEM